MILSQKIENNYKNCIEKKVKNKLEKAKMIKALICDLGGKGISIIANLLRMAFNTVKSYYLTDFNNIQLSIEFRGRKLKIPFLKLKIRLKLFLMIMNMLILILKPKLYLLIFH